ncbi:hypothetical protein ANN_16425 [Periplaneta americana]|uniref:Uncharacterized protein n=1 Tax=Periplaneta americana TaxID=6978 RepID=A0ABQ8SK29_PERAM|nr:hypothetical protein ANN_16425 [Periplaneta americana]
MTTQVTTVQPMTGQLSTVIKPQVSIILGYAIERELAKSHGGFPAEGVFFLPAFARFAAFEVFLWNPFLFIALAISLLQDTGQEECLVQFPVLFGLPIAVFSTEGGVCAGDTMAASELGALWQWTQCMQMTHWPRRRDKVARSLSAGPSFMPIVVVRCSSLANANTSTHVCDLMTSYDINIHSQHYPASSQSPKTFSWLEYRLGTAKSHDGTLNNTMKQKKSARRDEVVPAATDDLADKKTLSVGFIAVGVVRDEVTGEWRKLHNTELHALYSSPDIIRNIKSRRLRYAGHVARMGESRNAYRVLVGRPEGKRPLGRPRRRWEDNIKMNLREVGYDGRDWINLAYDRDQWRAYVRAAMNLWGRAKVSLYILYCDSDVRFELTTSVPQERRSRGALWDGARRRGERANAAREWRESARASGAGREERALDFSGVPSLETRGTFEATSLWL